MPPPTGLSHEMHRQEIKRSTIEWACSRSGTQPSVSLLMELEPVDLVDIALVAAGQSAGGNMSARADSRIAAIHAALQARLDLREEERAAAAERLSREMEAAAAQRAIDAETLAREFEGYAAERAKQTVALAEEQTRLAVRLERVSWWLAGGSIACGIIIGIAQIVVPLVLHR